MDSIGVDAGRIFAAVANGLFVTPLFILWCISLCLARRQGDPARSGIPWMKAIFPFSIVYATVPRRPTWQMVKSLTFLIAALGS